MKPPSERARLVLSRYKEAAALGPDAKARLGDALEQRVLRGDLPRFDIRPGTPSVPQATLAQRLWSSTWAKVGLGVVALGTASSVGYQLERAERPAALDAPAATVARAPLLAERAAAAEPAESPEQAAAPADEAAPKPPAATPPPRTKADKGPDAAATSVSEPTIDEEVKLVNGAQAALRAGDTKRALELLNEHAARFPSGKLATLRQVTHMMALCQSGHTQQARQEAANFLVKNPSSPFAERVSGICSASK